MKIDDFDILFNEGTYTNVKHINYSEIKERSCGGCDEEFFETIKNSEGYITQCSKCSNYFCLDCDIFIHNSLY